MAGFQWSEEALRFAAQPLMEKCPETFCDAANPCDDCLEATREALDNMLASLKDAEAKALMQYVENERLRAVLMARGGGLSLPPDRPRKP